MVYWNADVLWAILSCDYTSGPLPLVATRRVTLLVWVVTRREMRTRVLVCRVVAAVSVRGRILMVVVMVLLMLLGAGRVRSLITRLLNGSCILRIVGSAWGPFVI